jgi:hypothetical protein
MSEAQQELSDRIELPIDIHVPDTLRNQYVHNLIVQPGKEADFRVQAYIRAYHAVVPMRTSEEEEAEEREWEAIVSQPHVQQALRRMVSEVRRQIAVGETEEGGFAVE